MAAREDRAWLSAEMARERSERAQQGAGLRHVLSGKVGLLCLIYFLNTMATYGVFLFLPKILREASGFSGFKLSAITAIPFAVALVGMVLIGRHSDSTGEREWHAAGCAFTAATGPRAGRGLAIRACAHRPELHALAVRAALRSRASSGPSHPGSWAARRRRRASPPSTRSATWAGSSVPPSWAGCAKAPQSYTSGLLVLAAGLTIAGLLILTLKPRRDREAVAPGRAVAAD